MSDRTSPDRDRGMTLPEVLVAAVILATIATVLASAITVTFRQQSGTEGRLNVARAEQNVGMWVPADLASADTVTTDPGASPCGALSCPGVGELTGSNALLLTWTTLQPGGGVITTNVSYHFRPTGDGETFELARIECTDAGGSWSCTQHVVLRELPGPPGAQVFVPGVKCAFEGTCPQPENQGTEPSWVIRVSEPLAPDATSETQVIDPLDPRRKDANRVVVTVDGGGSSEGAGGGINQISITAGGTIRTDIAYDSVQGAPTPISARSRCGGPITLVVDESNSVGTAVDQVEAGVAAFVDLLTGTPTQVQVVRMQTRTSILGSSAWSRYFDMTDVDAGGDVATLRAAIPNLQGTWSGGDGGTNWEDSLFQTFYAADGTTTPIVPKTLVFFTDGVPTFDRLVRSNPAGTLTYPDQPPDFPQPPWAVSAGNVYSQVAFNRANHIATEFRSSVRMIGVGVGSGITGSSTWVANPGAGFKRTWERGFHTHQRVEDSDWDFWVRYQIDTDSRSNRERWEWRGKAAWDAWPGNKRDQGAYTRITSDSFLSTYLAINETPSDSDFVYRLPESGADWTGATQAEYDANNWRADATDGWRTTSKTYGAPYDQWEPSGEPSGWDPGEPDPSGYRSTKVFEPPFTEFEPAITQSTPNQTILARLIAGNDNGVPAIWNGTQYTNPEVADLYISPNWSQFDDALRAVALGECGGTLTLQTKLTDGSPAPVEFQYQRSTDGRVVKTTPQVKAATFDFSIPSGQSITVDVLPTNLSETVAYQNGSWTCRAGPDDRPVVAVPNAGGPLSGVQVSVGANEAVSCTLTVS